MVDKPSHDAVSLHVPQLLNEHFFGHGGNGAPQFRESPHLAAKQMEQDHELPSSLENAQHRVDAFGGGRLCMCVLTFR